MKQTRKPHRLGPGDPALGPVLELIRDSFAYMDGRIDPPSSMLRLSTDDLSAAAQSGEIWAIGNPPLACVILQLRPDALYLGKLAVAQSARGQGLARMLVDHAAARARALGRGRLELQTRVELVENHATFARLGFVETGRTAHAGYDRPTSITMSKALGPDRASSR
ncbi:GNAT family N-acetyltransferase [Marinibacterium sp. SX1]|uniref:GNAT family N-acetyltransferase n=1 Tax=Marinibacterium sp. SX1 TaxID=3388424 RepID=UPI003D17CD2D